MITTSTSRAHRALPDGFSWGAATSSYQVEGAWDGVSKGPLICDTNAHAHGQINNDDNAGVANHHYHRHVEDTALLRNLGANAYRVSSGRPRIFPNGTPSQPGLDFCDCLSGELLLLGAAIEPSATLHHRDLPC